MDEKCGCDCQSHEGFTVSNWDGESSTATVTIREWGPHRCPRCGRPEPYCPECGRPWPDWYPSWPWWPNTPYIGDPPYPYYTTWSDNTSHTPPAHC